MGTALVSRAPAGRHPRRLAVPARLPRPVPAANSSRGAWCAAGVALGNDPLAA